MIGFDALYIGSYGATTTLYGIPDTGYLGLQDMVSVVSRLVPLIDAPLIVDGEGGFGNPLHVGRTIRELERAGANAIHIEDHDFGKHIINAPRVTPLNTMLDKLKAALDARESEDTLIIGRTDSAGSLGVDEAFDRAAAFESVGADAVFIAAEADETWINRRQQLGTPLITINRDGYTAKKLGAFGVDAVLYWGTTQFAAQQAAIRTLATLREAQSLTDLESAGLPTMRESDEFFGIEQVHELAVAFDLL